MDVFRHTATLPAIPPFDLRQSVRALSSLAPCDGEQQLDGDTVRKALALSATEAVVAEVAPAPDAVRLTVRADRALSAAETAQVESAVRRWLSLDDDLVPFLDRAADDPPMRPVVEATHGLHQVRFASLAEAVAYFVLTQRTQQPVAAARKRRLAAAYGPSVTVDGVRWQAFPPLERLAGLTATELAPYTGRPQQADYLAAALGGVHLVGAELLREAPYREAEQALLGIRGIGAFTANTILLRALGRPDHCPLEMAQFAAVVAAVYGPGTPAERVRQRYGRYAGWWGYFARTGLGWLDVPVTRAVVGGVSPRRSSARRPAPQPPRPTSPRRDDLRPRAERA